MKSAVFFCPLKRMASIREFYKNKTILISGGTGFIGKVLIEKLLRSCSGVNKIYLLLREKKGQSAANRLETFKNDIVFQVIKKECPDKLNCLVAIPSDVSKINLGISQKDINLLVDVNIVFHCAASVRFDDPLRDALVMNTKGAVEMIKLALNMPFLDAYIHVSTTYCVADNLLIEEEMYPAKMDWKTAIKLPEHFSVEVLNALSHKLLGDMTNTYVYTKALSESVVNSYKDVLPIVIYRPSIVVGAEQEPMPGYVDNFNGPMGILMGTALGILRTQCMPTVGLLNGVPVDSCVKGMILAAFERSTNKTNETLIYNSASIIEVTYLDIIKIGRKVVQDVSPPEKIIWRPGGRITKCVYEFYARLIFTQIIPAIFVDLGMKLTNKKPFLFKLQRIIYNAQVALNHYSITSWKIQNNKFLNLRSNIKENESGTFSFAEQRTDHVEYIKTCYNGSRKYLLKQDDSTIAESKLNYNRMVFVDEVFKYFILLLLIWNVVSVFLVKFGYE